MAEHVSTPGGICKIIGIILNIIILGLESHAYDKTRDGLKTLSEFSYFFSVDLNWNEGLEATLIAFSVICLIGTGVILLLRISKDSDMIKNVDKGFHIFGALTLLIGAGCLFYAAFHVDSKLCTLEFFGTAPKSECRKGLKFFHKISAAVIAVLNSIIYIIIGLMANKGK